MITIYTIAYNEEVMMPYFISHYRKMFPGCRIVVYNNYSTDSTFDICAMTPNCQTIMYDTGNKLSDKTYLEIKNNCWKDAITDWVLIVDVDEHLYINQSDLKKLTTETCVKGVGYNMVNKQNNLDPYSITDGVRAESYDKVYLFNRSKISEINYLPGAHKANPVGYVVYSGRQFYCLHYKYLNLPYMIDRHSMFKKRLSEDNLKRGYGGHYKYSAERITKEFNDAKKQATNVRDLVAGYR